MGIDARMFIRTYHKYSEQEIRKISAQMCQVLGSDNFWLSPDENIHALETIKIYPQDGPDILPEPNEQFIYIHLLCRYYGIGYERGPWDFLRNVIEFFDYNLKESYSIWYGGDSSGVLAVQMTEENFRIIDEHYFKIGHAPYQLHFGTDTEAPKCLFCGDISMANYGGGNGKKFYSCLGCSQKFILYDAGSLVKVEKFC